jgi:hypothetical protein
MVALRTMRKSSSGMSLSSSTRARPIVNTLHSRARRSVHHADGS